MYGVRCVIELRWKDLIRLRRGGWGDSSVIKLRWKDLFQLGRVEVGGVGGIVPSLKFVGKTSFALSFVFPCLRISSPSTFTDTYRHKHISTRDTCGGGGSVWGGGGGRDNSVIGGLQPTH